MKVKRHYIYRMVNDTTGEFYIGQRSCKGEPSADVKYMGSGVVITKKVKKHPEQWRKEILCFASSPEQLNQAERWAIGTQWRDNPLCLNLCPGGINPGPDFWTEEQRIAQAERRLKYFACEDNRRAVSTRFIKFYADPINRVAQSERSKAQWSSEEARAAQSLRKKKFYESIENRAANAARQKEVHGTEQARAANSVRRKEQVKVRLTSPEGDPVEVSRNLLLDYLLRGYIFTQINVCVHNDELRQWCFYSGKKAVALLLSDCGWTYGQNNAYTRVGMAQVEDSRAGTTPA